jgi:organic radical activating enzyme
MYLQITTRCNMSCEHCCFACTAQGEDMTKKTWRNALALSEEIGSSIAIGGGEPTLHRYFRDFLLDAIAYDGDDMPPFIATNGSIKKTALLLARLAKSGVIMAALSQDVYHDPIDPEVVKAFSSYYSSSDDYREIRNVEQKVINQGRAKETNTASLEGCACEGWHVMPNGDLKPCGCSDAPILGNVNKRDDLNIDGIIRQNENMGMCCWKSLDKQTSTEVYEYATDGTDDGYGCMI